MSMFGGHPDPADPIEKIVQLAMLRFGVHNLNVSVQFGSGGPDAILVDHDGREYPMHNLVAHALTVPPNSDQFYQAIMAHVDAVVTGSPPPTPFPSAPAQFPSPAMPFPSAPVTFTDDRFALTEAPHVFPEAPAGYPNASPAYAEAPTPFPGLPEPFPDTPQRPAFPEAAPTGYPGPPAAPQSPPGWTNAPPPAVYPPPQPSGLQFPPATAFPAPQPSALQLPPGPSTAMQFPPPQPVVMPSPPPQMQAPQMQAPQMQAPPMQPPQDPLLSLARVRLVPESARNLAHIAYARPISAGLLAVLSTQTAPDILLTDEFLEGRNVTELFDAAFGNTMAEPFDANQEVAPGVRALAGDSPFTASKAVGMGLLIGRDLPRAPLGVVFGAPNRHQLFVHIVTGPDLIHAVNALANLVVANANDEAPGGVLSNLTYYWTEAGVEPIGFPNAEGKVQIEATGAFGRMLNEVMR